MEMRYIEIRLMEDGELGIGGTPTAGQYDIKEYDETGWTGGCYATEDNLVEKIKEALGNE